VRREPARSRGRSAASTGHAQVAPSSLSIAPPSRRACSRRTVRFERGAFTDAKQAKPGLFQTATGACCSWTRWDSCPRRCRPAPHCDRGRISTPARQHSERAHRCLDPQRQPTSTSERHTGAPFPRRFYQRLAGPTISLPPLRERGDDVIMLASITWRARPPYFSLPPRKPASEARVRLWGTGGRQCQGMANLMERAPSSPTLRR